MRSGSGLTLAIAVGSRPSYHERATVSILTHISIDVTVEYETDARQSHVEVYWLFTSCKKPALFNNVVFNDIEIYVTKKNPATSINNVETDNGNITTHYLYGGVENDSDFTADIVYSSRVGLSISGNKIV